MKAQRTKHHPHTLDHKQPKQAFAALTYSLVTHGLVVASAFAWLNIKDQSPLRQETLDLGYVFEEPPPVLQKPKPVPKLVPQLVQSPPLPKVNPLPPPKLPDIKELQDSKSEIAGTQKANPPKNPSLLPVATHSTLTNTDSVPFYKIKPKYPRAALVSGIQGWVLMKIDITESGEVENIRVVDGEQRSMFQDEAKRAVEKWKYRPFFNDGGQVIRKVDHLVKVNFSLRDV